MATARKTAKKATSRKPVAKASKRVVKKVTAKTSKKSTRKVTTRKVAKKVEEKILYKVLKPEGRELVSPSVRGILKLKYAVGKKTTPHSELLKLGYGIMVFEKVEDARYWFYGASIYEVRCGEVFDVPAKRLHRNVEKYYGENFSERSNPKPKWGEIAKRLVNCLNVENNWPRGSKMASYVIPIKQVQ